MELHGGPSQNAKDAGAWMVFIRKLKEFLAGLDTYKWFVGRAAVAEDGKVFGVGKLQYWWLQSNDTHGQFRTDLTGGGDPYSGMRSPTRGEPHDPVE